MKQRAYALLPCYYKHEQLLRFNNGRLSLNPKIVFSSRGASDYALLNQAYI